jgi:hypothetical protein
MSRSERIDFIRASGDPRVAVRVTTRDADAPNAPPRPSPAAENILKERIKSFGFRTWSESDPRGEPAAGPDFIVEGEATLKRLSMKLEASGLTVTKYALNGWTIKAIDRATGEEIYYNTKMPTGQGSWASEELAFQAIGTRIASEFSRDFFLSHVNIRMPERGKIYSVNEGNQATWQPGVQKWVEWLKTPSEDKARPYSARYVGSLVADFHRTLLKGGVFAYPADKKNVNGKLRLMYEAAPLALIAEQAGGAASTGSERILEIAPRELHQRVPLYIGSKDDVADALKFL